MENCLVTKLNGVLDIQNPQFLGQLMMELSHGSSPKALFLRPVTDGSLTVTFKGQSISGDGSTTINEDGKLIIDNKYDLRVFNFGYRIDTPLNTNEFEFCQGIEQFICGYGGMVGDISYLGKLSNLLRLQMGSGLNLYGNIVSIAGCPLERLQIHNSKVEGSIEKYVAARNNAFNTTSGSLLFYGNIGEVTFMGVKFLHSENNSYTLSWSPNSSNPAYTDIVYQAGTAYEKTTTIDSEGNVVTDV